jgi:SAM-dependent methyltransferase
MQLYECFGRFAGIVRVFFLFAHLFMHSFHKSLPPGFFSIYVSAGSTYVPGTGGVQVTGDGGHWETNYSARGPLWGGAVHSLPVLPPRVRVLELGCGNGKTLSALSHCGLNVTAIDSSPRAVQLAYQASRGTGVESVMVADILKMPFCEGSFGAVFAFHILGHLSAADRAGSLQELCRVTGPSGHIYFRDFSTADFRFGRGQETEPGTFLRGNGIRTHYFTPPEVVELFEGFTAESTGTCTWPMRVKGTDYIRSEITAVFCKNACSSNTV